MRLLTEAKFLSPEHIPEVIHFRDSQISSLAANLQPALRGESPLNSILIGPPATGKTCVLMRVFEELSDDSIKLAYVRCPLASTPYRVMMRVFESVCGHQAPQTGYPMVKLYDAICERLIEEGRVLIVALDELSALKNAGQVICSLLRAGEEYGVRVGIVGVTKEYLGFNYEVRSVFQPSVIHFPLYSYEEMRFILAERVARGFKAGCFGREALKRVVGYAFKLADLRFGVNLLRMAGIEAEKRGAERVEVKDVETAYGLTRVDFHAETLSGLSRKEREVLKQITWQAIHLQAVKCLRSLTG